MKAFHALADFVRQRLTEIVKDGPAEVRAVGVYRDRLIAAAIVSSIAAMAASLSSAK